MRIAEMRIWSSSKADGPSLGKSGEEHRVPFTLTFEGRRKTQLSNQFLIVAFMLASFVYLHIFG
jgi:hypothetical protein